ncbi:MAG: hypothetical protein WAO58_06545 [Fimbriimonadaceae bacterium]
MRDLASCSGPWSGFWIQGWTRGNMKLRLRFEKTDILGEGTDLSGDFTISGIFSPETNRVLFTKSYHWQSVDYSGLWDGQLIYGKWTLLDDEYGEQGEFEIWPDSEDQGLMAFSGSIEDVKALPRC